MSERTDLDFLNDILYSLQKAQSFISGMTFEEFSADEKPILPSFELWKSLERLSNGYRWT